MQVFLPQKTFKIKFKKNCSFSMNRSLLIVNFHKQPLKKFREKRSSIVANFVVFKLR